MRIVAAVLCAVIALGYAAGASAAASAESSTCPVDAFCPMDEVLHIDNDALFEGMDQTYQCGYVPVVRDGFACVVLPLVASVPVRGEQIIVSVDLGPPETCPFVYCNYSRDVHLKEWPVNDGAQFQEAYVVRFDLQLAQTYLADRYPVQITASGCTESGVPFRQMFTVYVTLLESSPAAVNDANTDSAESAGPADDAFVPINEEEGSASIYDDAGSALAPAESPSVSATPAPAPRLMLVEHSFDPAVVTAGEAFSAHIALRNMSESDALRNVEIDFVPEGSAIVTGTGASSAYFAKVAAGETVRAAGAFVALAGAGPEPQVIRISGLYEDERAQEYTFESSVSFEIVQPVRLDWDPVLVPASVRAGDTLMVAVQALNLGHGQVSNVRAQINAPGLAPEGSLFLGNIASGEAKSGDLYAYVEMLLGEDRYGRTSGTITLSAEDSSGQVFEMQQSFEMQIEPPVFSAASARDESEEDTDDITGQWAAACLAAAGAIIVLAFFVRRRKKKESNALRSS